jgi:hypothetical protein
MKDNYGAADPFPSGGFNADVIDCRPHVMTKGSIQS